MRKVYYPKVPEMINNKLSEYRSRLKEIQNSLAFKKDQKIISRTLNKFDQIMIDMVLLKSRLKKKNILKK